MDRLRLELEIISDIIYYRHRFHNLICLLTKKGSFICPNGFRLSFNALNKEDIRKLFAFCIRYGVELSQENGAWHYKDNVLELPNGIKFYVSGFSPIIFAETFLYNTHFINFNLENKKVIQAGGFIGDTALYYASRGAKVFSFEPNIYSFDMAIKNIELNPLLKKNIVFRNLAIGHDGQIEFPMDPGLNGESSAYDLKGKNVMKIRSASIRSLLNELNIDTPYLLDLDIKGKEFDIINDDSLSEFEMVRIEYSTFVGNKKVGNRDDLLKKLDEYGFKKIRIFKHNELPYDLNRHGTIEAAK